MHWNLEGDLRLATRWIVHTGETSTGGTPTAAQTTHTLTTDQTAVSTNASVDQTPTATTAAPSRASAQIDTALNLVIGTKERASVYSSYHQVGNLVSPLLSDDKASVVTQTSQITVDVQGNNVHLSNECK